MKYYLPLLALLSITAHATPTFHAQCLNPDKQVLGRISLETERTPYMNMTTTYRLKNTTQKDIVASCVQGYPSTKYVRYEFWGTEKTFGYRVGTILLDRDAVLYDIVNEGMTDTRL